MPEWSTTADWDAAQSETNVHHAQPTGTTWASADTVEMGYPETHPDHTYTCYWPMGESSGTTMNDVSGAANNGTINGATVNATPAPFGNACYSFDGTDDWVDAGTGNFTAGIDQSFFWWFFCDSDRTTDNRFFSLQGDIELIVNIGRNSTNEIQVFTNSAYQATGSTAAPGEWHSLAFAYEESSSSYEVYLDAVEINSINLANPLQAGGGTTCAIGRDDGGSGPFEGRMAHLLGVETYLSQAQVQSLHDAPF